MAIRRNTSRLTLNSGDNRTQPPSYYFKQYPEPSAVNVAGQGIVPVGSDVLDYLNASQPCSLPVNAAINIASVAVQTNLPQLVELQNDLEALKSQILITTKTISYCKCNSSFKQDVSCGNMNNSLVFQANPTSLNVIPQPDGSIVLLMGLASPMPNCLFDSSLGSDDAGNPQPFYPAVLPGSGGTTPTTYLNRDKVKLTDLKIRPLVSGYDVNIGSHTLWFFLG